MSDDNKDYQRFDDTMSALMKVPHSEIKEKLDAEKKQKKAGKPNTKAERER